ncbi:hypothetical protein [Streptomyces daghestanicus]|uniref:Uncharacterized protein n=1 Tax=Streptomyces daghestanicus TaxID=66885 RepID=A0ABQ3Q8E1_9ACTN|nr:hypothetical protein [Streptomyces daghestanicus]GGU58330.1 hypothetical protein GCM10010259_56700 [Streptomyces daghestanicus]GHI33551.1 hypothetical protein Sdagh_52810 [Streptomyces daghestanicus]
MAAATSDAFGRIGGITAPRITGTRYVSPRFTGVLTLICAVLAAGCVLTLTLSTSAQGRSLGAVSG